MTYHHKPKSMFGNSIGLADISPPPSPPIVPGLADLAFGAVPPPPHRTIGDILNAMDHNQRTTTRYMPVCMTDDEWDRIDAGFGVTVFKASWL